MPDENRCAKLLVSVFGAVPHPNQRGAYILDGLPFYTPRHSENHIYVLGFSNDPLRDSLVDAFVDHPESFPDEIFAGSRNRITSLMPRWDSYEHALHSLRALSSPFKLVLDVC